MSHKIGPIKYGPGMKYLLCAIQNVLYFASKYLKWSFEKYHMKSGPSDMVLVYLLNTVQQVQYFASKYLKWTFKKRHMKSGQSNVVLI